MSSELKDQRIPVMMSLQQVDAIDEWMFANKVRSRAGAIRRLIDLGLRHDQNKLVAAELIKIIKEYNVLENAKKDDLVRFTREVMLFAHKMNKIDELKFDVNEDDETESSHS